VASHRRPKPVGRTRASILTAAAATAVALSTQTSAHADPAPTLDQVKSQVDDLNNKAEAANQAYQTAQQKQQDLQKQVSNLQDQVARQQDQVTNLENGLAGVAADQYANDGISPTVQLVLNSNPDTFLNQAGSISQLNATQGETLKQLQQEQRKLDQDKTDATGKLAELDATTAQLKSAKDDAQTKLKAAQDLLNSLTAQQRQAIAAQEAQAAAASQAAAKAAAQQAGQQATASRGTARTDLSSIPAGSHAAAAIAAAESALGSPYVYGAAGPSTFDCSGLMQWAYAKAGVSLPRTSQEQATAGTNMGTDIANAQPGDLIIYFSDMHHVGMYVGGGQIIHAPHTGAVVHYESATVMPIAAIIRV
jgi:cell wall-associated NlpC family hydrolase